MVLHKIKPLPLTTLIGLHCKFNNRLLSICSGRYLSQKWREEHNLPENPNAYGPLTDKPDYSFLDGRPTPYGVRQRKRMITQKVIAQQIITLTKEVDFAVERHAKLKEQEEENRKSIINSKLKPKGILLLKEKGFLKTGLSLPTLE